MTESTAKLRSGRARALRQRMYLSIISPCQAWVRWSVPLGAKYRKAVNSGSSGSGGALPRSPLRTGHAAFQAARLKQALKARCRVEGLGRCQCRDGGGSWRV